MPPSIIRATCRFDSKFKAVSRDPGHVTRYVERNKNFFRKVELFHFLPSFFAENCSKIDAWYSFLVVKVEQLLCSGRYLFHEASFCQRYRLRPPAIGIAVMKAALMSGGSRVL